MLLVQKWPFFQLFFLGNLGQEDVFYDILERKNAFLGYKNKKFKKVEKLKFFQRGEPVVLVQKWPFFQLFLSGNVGQKNILNDILEGKNAFQGYKKKKFKKSKNWHFSQGVTAWFLSKNDNFSNFFSQLI